MTGTQTGSTVRALRRRQTLENEAIAKVWVRAIRAT